MSEPSSGMQPTEAVFQAEREGFEKPAPDNAPFRKRQVIYGQVDGRELPGTLYLPRDRNAPAPAMVWVHGGGWRGGDRGQFARHCAFMAATAGIAGLCITYRLCEEAKWPAPMQDAHCGVRWLRANAGELGVDPDRIGIGGSSAGAHIAAMAAVTGDDDICDRVGGREDRSQAVRAGAFFNGVFELPKRDGETLDPSALVCLFGGTPQEVPDLYREASPIRYVSPAAPPAFLPHGEADTVISHKQSIRFADALRDAGVEVDLMLAPDTGHGQLNSEANFEPVLRRLIDFLARL